MGTCKSRLALLSVMIVGCGESRVQSYDLPIPTTFTAPGQSSQQVAVACTTATDCVRSDYAECGTIPNASVKVCLYQPCTIGGAACPTSRPVCDVTVLYCRRHVFDPTIPPPDQIDAGVIVDAGTQILDGGSTPQPDAGTPVIDAGIPADAGVIADGGASIVDAGIVPPADGGAASVVDAGVSVPPVVPPGALGTLRISIDAVRVLCLDSHVAVFTDAASYLNPFENGTLSLDVNIWSGISAAKTTLHCGSHAGSTFAPDYMQYGLNGQTAAHVGYREISYYQAAGPRIDLLHIAITCDNKVLIPLTSTVSCP